MKKLLSLFLLCTILFGCEIGVRPVPVPTKIVFKGQTCGPEPYDTQWASYCDGTCCYEEYYDNGWLCEEAWCYDYYYCSWEYMGEICY